MSKSPLDIIQKAEELQNPDTLAEVILDIEEDIKEVEGKVQEIKVIAEITKKLQGEKGEKGKDGKDGINGTNGKNGVNGKDGSKGKDGKDGKNGKDGIDGLNGTDGVDGTNGSPDTGEQIVDKINKQDTKIDRSKIKDLDKDIKELKERQPVINNIIQGQGGASGIRDVRAGSGISVSKVNDVYTITNTAPDTTPVDSVTNSDGSVNISPTTGAVVISAGNISPFTNDAGYITGPTDSTLTETGDTLGINLANPNTWTGVQHFNLADETFTPTPPTSGSITFTQDMSGFFANGIFYQYYIYSYYYTGTSTAYDNGGYYVSATDPNDGNDYYLDLSWSGASQVNGYIIYDVNSNQYIDVGNVSSYQITPGTAWIGGTPTLSPTTVTVPHSAAWFQSGSDYFASDFTPFKFGYNGAADHLQFRWDFAQQHLRFENAFGTIQEINTNIHADAVYAGTLTTGTPIGISYGGTGASSFGANRIPYMNSGNTAMTSTANFAHLTNTSKIFIGNETTTTNKVLTLRGMASQSGNLLELQNSSATLLSAFTSDGRLGIGGAPDAGVLLHSKTSGNAETILESTGGVTPYAGYSLKSTTGKWGMFVGGSGHPSVDGDFGIFDWDASLYRFVIKDTGFVGIGNTAPTYKFTVGNANTMTTSGGFGGSAAVVLELLSDTTSSGYTQLAIQGPTNGGAAIQIYNGSGVAVMDFGMNINASEAGFINRMTSGIMSFYTHNGSTLDRRIYIASTGNVGIGGAASTAPNLIVLNSGNVGIGNTAPTYPLTVGTANTVTSSGGFGGGNAVVKQLISSTSSGFYTQLAIQGPTNGGAAIEIYNGTGTAVADFGMDTNSSSLGFINRMTSGKLDFWTHDGTSLARRIHINATGDIGIAGDAVSTPKLRVMSSGLVGIGNTAPGAKLDVNGAARYAGTATVPTASGVGQALELWYYTGGGGPYGVVLAYDRDTSAYKPIRIAGSDIGFEEGSTRVMTIDGGLVKIDGGLQCDTITNDTGLAHGTYTPTLTGVANVTSTTSRLATYMRVGNTVTVAGQLDVTPTGAGTVSIGISLPVASNFSTVYQAGGTGHCAAAVTGHGMFIAADVTNDRVQADYYDAIGSTDTFSYTFTFQVI